MASTHQFDAAKLFSTSGKVAVVTGGGTGIGLMAAQALAANGAKVYITGRRLEALDSAAGEHSNERLNGGQIIPIGPCDVTSKHDLEQLVSSLRKDRGEACIDVLICAAGISGPKAPPEHENAEDLQARLWDGESVEEWQNTYRTNVTACYFTTVAFLPLLQAGMRSDTDASPSTTSTSSAYEGGNIKKDRSPFHPCVITISSMSGLMRHAQGHFSYNASKAATVHLTKLMSAEFQRAGIRVNSIAPGYFPSEMTAAGESDDRQKSYLSAESIQEKGHVPLARAGREEEMGMTVLYLANNQYVNGEIVAVDGGVLNVLAGR